MCHIPCVTTLQGYSLSTFLSLHALYFLHCVYFVSIYGHSLDLNQESVPHMLRLVFPLLEHQLMLAKNVQLIEALQVYYDLYHTQCPGLCDLYYTHSALGYVTFITHTVPWVMRPLLHTQCPGLCDLYYTHSAPGLCERCYTDSTLHNKTFITIDTPFTLQIRGSILLNLVFSNLVGM